MSRRLRLRPITPTFDFSTLTKLSDRERAVGNLLLLGHSNQEIADTLGVTHTTIKNHVGSILAKCECPSRHRFVCALLRQGMLTLPETEQPEPGPSRLQFGVQ